MENAIRILMLIGDQIAEIVAFIAIFKYAFSLYRERLEGAPYLLFGCISVILGEAVHFIMFIISPMQWQIFYLLLETLGYFSIAYGFATFARATIKNIKEVQVS